MKNIGITTHFYKSTNYGGVLQAFALCKVLVKQGHVAKQICFVNNIKRNNKHFFRKIFKIPKIVVYKIISPLFTTHIEERLLKFQNFNIKIPHTAKVYNETNIVETNACFDGFITGSDQVWHPNVINVAYLLGFTNKKKVAYAASLAVDNLNINQQQIMKEGLVDFNAVSVREKDMVDLLQPLTDKKIEWVLDPTLLLDKGDWDEICPERRIKEKYLFCYFLGQDKRIRKLAKRYAKKHGLKIVNLPHLCGIAKADIGFGDYKLYDVAPDDFVSLIKYSECVFTDSFHACVFSGIYNKNFVAFNRHGMESMATRLYSLCELFECQDHFCDVKEKFNMDYIDKIGQVDYNKNFDLLKEMKNKSIEFLNKNLD